MSADVPAYSRHLGPIRTRQFEAALSRFGLGTFVSAAPRVRGTAGPLCLPPLSEDTARCVLRDWQLPKSTARPYDGTMRRRCFRPRSRSWWAAPQPGPAFRSGANTN